jgi:GR25 family glycosyltransferase involved in LPS biosynthesis
MIAVLNLDRSGDRKELMEAQLNKIGVKDYLFFPAYDSSHIRNLSFGATITTGYGLGRKFLPSELMVIFGHIGIIKHAQMMGYENIIIMEDDVVLCDDWNSRIEKTLEELPSNWEYAYLSGHSDYVKFNKIFKFTILPAPKMVGAFSYMINKSAYSKIANYCSSLITTYDDMIMKMVENGKLNAFLVQPFLTFHDANESLIWEKGTANYVKGNGGYHSSYEYFAKHL